MKSTQFWVLQFFGATAVTYIFLAGAALLRGRSVERALSESAMWAFVAAAIFTGSRYQRARKGAACALCKDPADSSGSNANSANNANSKLL